MEAQKNENKITCTIKTDCKMLYGMSRATENTGDGYNTESEKSFKKEIAPLTTPLINSLYKNTKYIDHTPIK